MKRRTTILAASVAALVLIGTAAYVALDRERKTLDAAARAAAPGKFVQLRDGITHYDLSGPDTGRAIILLSGATVPFYIWDPTRDALAANGFRVLRYDYFGRGFSDRPTLRYDLATFDRQLAELLDTLGIRGPVDVAGISMGGVIAENFADRHPDRVRSLTLVLETVRGDVFKRPAPSFAVLAKSRIPMLILWGKADRTVPFSRSATVRAAFPRAEFHAIDGAAHLPQIEQAARVDSLLVSFLRAH